MHPEGSEEAPQPRPEPNAVPDKRRKSLNRGVINKRWAGQRKLLRAGSLISDEFPADLRAHLLELEEWAQANKWNATWDTLGFWSLKMPAILVSASAGVWAHFGLTTASVLAGAIASACVLIDGIHPRGMLRDAHIQAYYDIKILLNRMVSEWRSRRAGSDEVNAARRIIREAEGECQRIQAYIRDAEAALRYKDDA